MSSITLILTGLNKNPLLIIFFIKEELPITFLLFSYILIAYLSIPFLNHCVLDLVLVIGQGQVIGLVAAIEYLAWH